MKLRRKEVNLHFIFIKYLNIMTLNHYAIYHNFFVVRQKKQVVVGHTVHELLLHYSVVACNGHSSSHLAKKTKDFSHEQETNLGSDILMKWKRKKIDFLTSRVVFKSRQLRKKINEVDYLRGLSAFKVSLVINFILMPTMILLCSGVTITSISLIFFTSSSEEDKDLNTVAEDW